MNRAMANDWPNVRKRGHDKMQKEEPGRTASIPHAYSKNYAADTFFTASSNLEYMSGPDPAKILVTVPWESITTV